MSWYIILITCIIQGKISTSKPVVIIVIIILCVVYYSGTDIIVCTRYSNSLSTYSSNVSINNSTGSMYGWCWIVWCETIRLCPYIVVTNGTLGCLFVVCSFFKDWDDMLFLNDMLLKCNASVGVNTLNSTAVVICDDEVLDVVDALCDLVSFTYGIPFLLLSSSSMLVFLILTSKRDKKVVLGPFILLVTLYLIPILSSELDIYRT